MTIGNLIEILEKGQDIVSYEITEDQIDRVIEAYNLEISDKYDAFYFFRQ